MKIRILPAASLWFATSLCCVTSLWWAAPLGAQPEADAVPGGLPFPVVTPAQAERLAILQPLKLRLDNVTVAWALEQLQAQSGVELDMENLQYSKRTLGKRISLDIETRSFNRAFDEIMGQAKLRGTLERYDFNRPWRVNLNPSAGGEGAPQSGQGLFAVRLASLNTRLSRAINLTEKEPVRAQQNELTAQMILLPDPRLPGIGAARLRLTRADDEAGRSLLAPDDPNQRRNELFSFYNNYQQQQTNLTLLPPAQGAQTLAHLEGTIVYALITKTERWEVPDLLGAPALTHEFTNGNQKFFMTVKAAPTQESTETGAVKGSEKSVTLAVEVASDAPTPSGQIPPPMLASEPVAAAIQIRDANGISLRRSGGGGSGGGDKMTSQLTFYLDNGNASKIALPLKMTFDAPLNVVQTEAPFSFENLPLP